MAKKKTDSENTTALSIFDSIKESYGDVISSGRDLINRQQEIIKVSPRIDAVLHGGIPESSTVFISGLAKGGKTSLILRVCQQAQLQNREIWWIDVEHRLKKMNIEGCFGLDVDKINHIHSIPGNILSAEKVLTIAKQILTDVPRSVVVIDSFGALITEGELVGELKGSQRNDLHKLLSLFYRTLAPIVAINRNVLIGTQHIYSNTSGIGYSPWMEGGSSKGRYLSDIKLRIKGVDSWEIGPEKRRIGQTVRWICDYSALGAPGGECESYLRYGVGIDVLQEMISMGTDAGLIVKSGAWYACPFITNRTGGEKIQMQGEAKLWAAIAENEDWKGWLEDDLKNLGVV